jgi:DNA-binding MarR family transcriptional regulator
MPTQKFQLDSMVCFAIYSASNAVAKAHRAVLEPWELTYTQYIALLETGRSPDGLAVRELGARMHLDSGTLSPLLRRLEDRGLLTRVRNSADERLVTARLTEAGSAALAELLESLDGLRDAYGFESAEQAHSLVVELQRITEGMRHLAASQFPAPKGTP